MRPPIAVCLVSTLLALNLLFNLPSAGDDSPPNAGTGGQDEKAASKVNASDKAVVRDIVYGLEEEENRLYLTSQPLDGADRQLKRVELKFDAPKDGRIVELSLAKLGSKNLMAVIKIKRGDEYDFHCLTFIGPWGGGHVRDQHAFHKAKFFSTADNLRILAVGGKHIVGSVFIVLGDMGPDEKDGETWVTEGVFYFSGCPWPPSDGTLSHFRVKAVPPESATN